MKRIHLLCLSVKPIVACCIFLGIFMMFYSCNKSKEGEFFYASPRIKTITHYNGSKADSENYEYDASGRVIKITYSNLAFEWYEYRTDTILWKPFYFLLQDMLILNNEGWVTADLYQRASYEYYPGGNLSKATFYSSDGNPALLYEYKMIDGNTASLDLWELVDEVLKVAKTYEYEYLPNSVNTIGNENMGKTFYGKQDKNLVSVKKLTDLSDNSQEVTRYHYQLDAKKRVIKKWEEGSPEDMYTTYTYFE